MTVTSSMYDIATDGLPSRVATLALECGSTDRQVAKTQSKLFLSRCRALALGSDDGGLSVEPKPSAARTDRLRNCYTAYNVLRSSIEGRRETAETMNEKRRCGTALGEVDAMYALAKEAEFCNVKYLDTFKRDALASLDTQWAELSEGAKSYSSKVNKDLNRFSRHASLLNGPPVELVRTGFGNSHSILEGSDAVTLLDMSNTALQTSLSEHAKYLKTPEALGAKPRSLASAIATVEGLDKIAKAVMDVTMAQYTETAKEPATAGSQGNRGRITMGWEEWYDLDDAYKTLPESKV